MRLNLDSEIGLARFGVETKHETKPNLPNSADTVKGLGGFRWLHPPVSDTSAQGQEKIP